MSSRFLMLRPHMLRESRTSEEPTELDIIINLKNAGAHASFEHKRREVSKSEIKEMIDAMRIILSKLANVGILVAKTAG